MRWRLEALGISPASTSIDRKRHVPTRPSFFLTKAGGGDRVEKRTPRLGIIRIPFPRGIQGAVRGFRVCLFPYSLESRIFAIVCSFGIRYYFHTRCRWMHPNYAIRGDPRSERNRRYSESTSADSRKPPCFYYSHRCAGAPRRLHHLDTGGDKATPRHVQELRRRRAG